jgi:hypothetical protein
MRKLDTLLPALILAAVLMGLASCETTWLAAGNGNKGLGPPAHARAYGLRGKQQIAVNVNVKPEASASQGQIENVSQQANTTIVNITNSNGSITPVTLKRSGNVWIGPRGEQYLSVPTAEQLKPVYGM